ncbi:acyl-CoA thioesterase [Flaviflexus sp.]|uniref:acyl-CoA thioesterase n=1 Tax=Flaviflexus sp. TaxID=1969482 RepID=UPI003F8F386A
MSEQFSVRVSVRGYEIDGNGHVSSTVLMQYGQHSRWEALQAAGIDYDVLAAGQVGPVSLEETIWYRHEVLAGDELDVTCTYHWGEGHTFRIEQELHRSDGILLAEIASIGGVLDLTSRRLVADPASYWRQAAARPDVIGL